MENKKILCCRYCEKKLTKIRKDRKGKSLGGDYPLECIDCDESFYKIEAIEKSIVKTKTYQIIHKLTKKPVRHLKTFEILVLEHEEAFRICQLKNKVMGADFYTLEEV